MVVDKLRKYVLVLVSSVYISRYIPFNKLSFNYVMNLSSHCNVNSSFLDFVEQKTMRNRLTCVTSCHFDSTLAQKN